MNILYRVELREAEGAQLTALLSGGKHAARKLKRAQILLAADAGGSDDVIANSARPAVPRFIGRNGASSESLSEITRRPCRACAP